ncbi:ABC transporter ATP-binding protein [Nesterenkonia alba]|uniref:ABC transporter ATP-binding protein n=1 Tax=Nesterenkonia alba TaxID=515814 RepID=UPI0003B4C2CE|nr:dipeptide ABC transporter ATP-binding protein [Nesterenkonia alba]
MTTTTTAEPLLQVRNLQKHFPIKKSTLFGGQKQSVKAVDGVSFDVYPGESLGIVGESGCGKSTTGRMLLRLLEPTGGEVIYQGRDIAQISAGEMRMLRKDIQIVFQDPFASLNPRMRVRQIVEEPLMNFRICASRKEARQRAREILEQVGLGENHMERFPHEFSGGQRQRIGIARALASEPKLIIADEPVSALDVSIQAQVLNLMKSLQKEYGFSFVFISHDLSVVKHFCDRIGVMYLGKLVEVAEKKDLYAKPMHPYAQALLSAIPRTVPGSTKQRIVLQGDVPSPANPPAGCPFNPRCPAAFSDCTEIVPELISREGRQVACHLYPADDPQAGQQQPTAV